ncbi:nicotinate-nucleotide adenylyltransferase [Jannaschia aquimarina]|uniref:Probable nicotinate-nucleotide adenylyltransferase n=1 Tax=Jannaschia aquimarina TaxID=935700 RepID=A0A0D1EEA5_9RHOB|nr:nicotinate-nucleotide adenylyltransferase [Jannaschia aquimarina]KIT14235.1 putative nicotinate-nucleotide adenylyltransferase [Jannaschia aquimarina]SNS48862.1 nicotinate-nucleotide adenylyltransferase [Jannaschia aquimarina]
MRLAFPSARPGMVVGLLGGSFDPAHAGHVHITRAALSRFGLDRVWWLVSPGNPLKTSGPAPLDKRLGRARTMMRHPRVEVTDLESRLGTRYTARTLRAIRLLYPGRRFVWLMGADNLAQFHLWDDWRTILRTTPVGIVARPGERMRARMSPAAHAFRRWQLPEAQSHRLGRTDPPAWCLINVPMHPASSTDIRRAGDWS